jgi:hypothetical protein
MSGMVHKIASVLFMVSVAALGACGAEPPEPGVEGLFEEDAEPVAEVEEALHEQACLNAYDSSMTFWYNAGSCGGYIYDDLSSGGATYGTADCSNQFRTRFTIDNEFAQARPRVSWVSPALTSSGQCGVALVTGTFWAKRRSDGVWVRLADTEHVGQWNGYSCSFHSPVSGWDNFPSLSPAVYSHIHVAASASYLFQKQPVKVVVALDRPPC